MFKKYIFGLLFLQIWFFNTGAYAFCSDEKYLQEVKDEITLPVQAGKNVVKLLAGTQGVILAVTSKGVFRYRDGKWNGEASGSDWVTAALDARGDVWLASTSYIQKENTPNQITLPENAKTDTIRSLFWENSKTLFVSTSNGLLSYDGNWKKIIAASGSQVYGVAKDSSENLWVPTSNGLLYRKNGTWFNMDDRLMAGGNNRKYFSVATTNHDTDILYGSIRSVGCIAANGEHWIARGPDGLPYGPAKVIKPIGGAIWYGTDRGAIKKDEKWHYYNDKRWLPDNQVNDILPITPQTVWIATPQGISQIRQVEMTLEEKATAFEERIQKRHLRHGLVARSKLN